ncbi:hypothetical protein [Nitrosospira sp. Nsp13]|jgi:hypothetical protein|uniref:hypothetical protein n=1 Tax=Nitrosospira sp. Nsp13 TaxID=1855332 RepID=UPI00088E6620|nr:hypothetical protein [Nitrosospira sp. Nsp13]SCY33543.1 hypothetical protein SAMN05216308_10835 [Nitrosospira sp. Nsp13]
MSENILRIIGGQYVSEALQTLPDAEKSNEDFIETGIKLPVFGLVRFKCQRMTDRQGKNRYRFWTANEAFKVE